MSKARTLADFISDGSEFADGTISVAEVSGAAPLASPTFTGTVTVPTLTSTGNISLGYDDKILLGDNNELQIYTSSDSNIYIKDTGSGSMFLDAAGFYVTAGGNNIITGLYSSGVKLYNTNAVKLQTVSDGVDITGKTTTDELDLNALAAFIFDTAVDIFVYDTRKDSDGGAWRKRTQHTSWYNETLNTATRGSRKEFPAVAVIVLRTNAVTIYDGDDPDLPMWWYGNSSNIGGYALNGAKAVSMLNGLMVMGSNDSTASNYDGLRVLDFIRDYGYWTWYNSNGSMYESAISPGSAGVTSKARYYPFLIKSGNIPTKEINDVAMTVLPNAPIDAATGLPVPTIAVATDGGLSVIKDDGTVVDSSLTVQYNTVSFMPSGYLVASESGGSFSTEVYENYSSDSFSFTRRYDNTGTSDVNVILPMRDSIAFKKSIAAYREGYGYGTFLINEENTNDPRDNGLGAAIKNNYNTGWMNGDIKLATLSDTDDTDVTGSELVTNGTFDSDISGWSAYRGATLALASNTIEVTGTGTAGPSASQEITTVAGKTYVLSVDIVTNSGSSGRIGVGSGSGDFGSALSYDLGHLTDLTTGTFSITFTASDTGTWISLSGQGSLSVATFDNVSVRLAEEDRSVNGNGLQVFGTVTKNPVATGADLVAYSGFGTGKYLKQPHNTDLNLTSSTPFSAVCWVKNDGTSFEQIYKYRPSDDSGAFHQFLIASNVIRFALGDGTNTATSDGATTIPTNVWNCFVVTFDGNNTISVYLNGVLDDTTLLTASGATGNFYESDAFLKIGVNQAGSNIASGTELALLRLSRTCLTPEQIAKIYEDEKVLFQENAQATLYGSSDAVTALAYDDSTELLHVGTSAGRSVFQGLRRVDNTTTAVGAAISASNGLVADE